MSKERAHQVLDDLKAGKWVPLEWIDQALRATGDLAHEWPVADEE